MQEKLATTQTLIHRLVERAARPVVSCSFGKDSLALLHITRKMGHRLPVVFYRDPVAAPKYGFAHRIIESWSLTVYDPPPVSVALQRNPQPTHDQKLDFILQYPIGAAGATIGKAFGAYDPTPMIDYACGLRDVLAQPLGMYRAPWDLYLCGAKSCDTPTQGVPGEILFDVKHTPGVDLAYPLRAWSDEEVWQYIEKNQVPIDHGRYERTASGWLDKLDRTLNSDKVPCCMRCMDPDAGPAVECPQLERPVANVSRQVPWLTAPTRNDQL